MTTMVQVDVHEGIAKVTLDRPPANAMSHETMVELRDVARRLIATDVRAVVLTGGGRFFSAGLDLFDLLSYDDARFAAFSDAFDDAMTAWFALDRPVVVAINGHAIAGGAILAATGDFRLVADAPLKIGLTEVLVGVPFPISALEIVRYACAGTALVELLYRGSTYGPTDAVARRLADEVVPAAELLDRSIALARELAGHRPEALLPSKRALRAEALARIAGARGAARDAVWRTWRTPETIAAMQEFRARTVRK